MQTAQWTAYLDQYHAERSGITEELLAHAEHRDAVGPYAFLVAAANSDVGLTERRRSDTCDPLSAKTGASADLGAGVQRSAGAGLGSGRRLLDVACGSAPIVRLLPASNDYLGIDRAAGELSVARTNYPDHSFIQGDALTLPFPDATFDIVTCSMALMLLQPLGRALQEIRRVMTTEATFVAMYPSAGLPHASELASIVALTKALRTMPELPQYLRKRPLGKAMSGSGLQLTSHLTRHYTLPIADEADADRLVNGLYLPSVSAERVDQARDALRNRAGPRSSLPLHITHVTAAAA